MRRIQYLIAAILLFMQSCGSGLETKDNDKSQDTDIKGSISINGSEVLFPLVTRWVNEFNKEFPQIVFDNRANCSDYSLKMLDNGTTQIAMISRELTPREQDKGLWAVPVALDAVLPVINFNNDFIQPIVQKGISKQKLAGVFNGSIKTWGQLLGNGSVDAIEAFVLPDSSGTSHVWAQFLQMDVKKLRGTCLYSNPTMANTLAANKFGIGYCSMSRIFDPNTNYRRNNLYVVPVDLNANGQADDNELVFDKLDDLKTAIISGKYPAPPVRKLYFVTKNPPNDEAVKTFILWVLGIGQNFCVQSGLLNIEKTTAETFSKQFR